MKPENRCIGRVNKHLPGEIYYLKLNLPYTGGVADSYYSGVAGDLWVEYKWLPVLPRKLCLTDGKDPYVTRLQRLWLIGRHAEGRCVRIFVGSPEGVLIVSVPEIDATWDREEIRNRLVDEVMAAEWIEQRTHGLAALLL